MCPNLKIGRHVEQRREHEAPLKQPRVRDRESRRLTDLMAKEEQVEVDRTWPPPLSSMTDTTQRALDLKEAREEPFWGARPDNPHGGVPIARLRRAYGLGVVNRTSRNERTSRRGFEKRDGGTQGPIAAAKVRPEPHDGVLIRQ